MKYLSVSLAPGHPAIGDVAAETVAIFHRAGSVLEQEGLTFGDVMHTRFFYSSHDDFAPMAAVRSEVYATAFIDGGFPASSGLVAGPRGQAEQRLEIEFVAGEGKRTFDAIDDATSGVVKASPYHHATSAEGLLYVSGFLGSAGDSAEQQFGHAMRNLQNALTAAARTLADALSITIYICRIGDAAVVAACLDALLATLGGASPVVPVVSVLCVHELSFDGYFVAIEAVASDGEAVSRALVRENQLGELGVALPRHATATGAGPWLFANGVGFVHESDVGVPTHVRGQAGSTAPPAPSGPDDFVSEAFAAALAEAGAGLEEIAPAGWRDLRATIWYAPASARNQVVALALAAFGDAGTDITRFPLRVPDSTCAAVHIQLTARAS